jgi:hypothetical protein
MGRSKAREDENRVIEEVILGDESLAQELADIRNPTT